MDPLLCTFSLLTALLLPASDTDPAFAAPEHRAFDFWLGTWDVNLRIRQEDLTWNDAKTATAHVHPVLGGKAVLELWDENAPGDGIRGMSLRHYDAATGEWVLHLNWPGPNRSGLSSLRGGFRHGRGEFFSERAIDDSTTLTSRYTFCDIAPDRLRWEDAYSRDGGRTWSESWIMEFSRTGDRATWPKVGEKALTMRDGERCTGEAFRLFDALRGAFTGKVIRGDERGRASFDAWPIVDGCATIGVLRYAVAGERHELLTYYSFNTYAGVLESAVLDDRPGTGVRIVYGPAEASGAIVLESRASDPHRERHTYRFEDDGIRIDIEPLDDRPAWTVALRRAVIRE